MFSSSLNFHPRSPGYDGYSFLVGNGKLEAGDGDKVESYYDILDLFTLDIMPASDSSGFAVVENAIDSVYKKRKRHDQSVATKAPYCTDGTQSMRLDPTLA